MMSSGTGGAGAISMPGLSGQDEVNLANALKTLPNYETEKKLGEGGMGSVYRAKQRTLNRTVAIKVLPQRLSTDKRYSARLLREAQVLAKINHANVIACYDVGEHHGLLYVVMEFVEGESLYQLIQRRGQMPLEEGLSYLKQSVLGLDHANAVGVIHRDIKPENLLVSTARPQGSTIRANPFGTLKIADLGLAAYTDDSQQNTRLTVEGSALGSPYYMSPEQTLGEKNLDFRTDIYALGITLYHMLTGKTPYEAQTIGAILAKKLSETIADPRSIRPDLPAGLSLLLQRMTARKKEDRYESYGDLLRDIEALEAKQPLVSQVLPIDRGSVTLLPDTLKALGAKAAPRRSSGDAEERGGIGKAPPSNNVVLIAGGLVGLLLLIMAVLFFFGGSRPVKSVQAPSPAPSPVIAPTPVVTPPANPQVTPTPVQPPRVDPAPQPVSRFSPRSLITNKSTQGWTSTGDRVIFGFEAEDDALSLQAPPGKKWCLAEANLPSPECKVTGSLKIVQGADNCEVRFAHGGKHYVALGIRFPLDAKNKVTAYLETREAGTDKATVLNSQDGFDPDAWTDIRVQIWEGQAVCWVNEKPFGSAEMDPEGLKTGRLVLATINGIGLFRNLWVLPRPDGAEKAP